MDRLQRLEILPSLYTDSLKTPLRSPVPMFAPNMGFSVETTLTAPIFKANNLLPPNCHSKVITSAPPQNTACFIISSKTGPAIFG